MMVEILNEDGDSADEREARAVLNALDWPNPHRLEATDIPGDYEVEASAAFTQAHHRDGFAQALTEVDGVRWVVRSAGLEL